MSTREERLRQFSERVAEVSQTPGSKLERLLLDINYELIDLMEREKVTKTELAERLGVTQAMVSKLLNGNRNLTVKTLVNVAEALNVEVDIVFRERKSMVWSSPSQQVERERIPVTFTPAGNANQESIFDIDPEDEGPNAFAA